MALTYPLLHVNKLNKYIPFSITF